MKTLKLSLTLAIILIMASCKSTKKSILSTPTYAPAAEINPIRANVEVDMTKKLIGESSTSYFLFFRTGGDNKFVEGMKHENGILSGRVGKTKSAAAYNAIKDSDADIIVHPNYIVDVDNFLFFKKIKVKVTGYKGKFTKFYQKEYIDERDNKLNDVELKIDLKSKK